MDNEACSREEVQRRVSKPDEARGERLAITADAGNRWPIEMDNETCTPEEEIRRRAYQHYEARGRVGGHDRDDWLRAEAEIRGEMARAAAA